MTSRKLTIEDVIDTRAKIAIGLSAAAIMGALAQSWLQGPPPKGKRRRPPPLFWIGVAGSVGTIGWLFWRKRTLQQAIDRARREAMKPASATPTEQAARAARSALQARLATARKVEPPSPEIALEPIVAQLTPDEREKLAAVFAELPEESRATVATRLAGMRTDAAVAYIRDLLERHTAPPLAEAA